LNIETINQAISIRNVKHSNICRTSAINHQDACFVNKIIWHESINAHCSHAENSNHAITWYQSAVIVKMHTLQIMLCVKHIRQLSLLTLKEIIWSRNCNEYHIRKLSKYCKWQKLCKRIEYSNFTAQLRKINANHACMHKVCENQSEYCYSARIMNERWEYNNLAFIIYMH